MILRVSTIVFIIFCVAIVKGDDAETCKELCKSCNGYASFVDNRCECNVGDNKSDGSECVIRMKREAEDRGLNLSSCDLSNDKRTTRCTLGLKRKLLGKTKNAIDQVVHYFMNGGPITGSVFQAPPYAKFASGDCLGSHIIVQPSTETIASPAISYTGQPQHFVSIPGSDCITGAQQQIPNPTDHLLSGPHQQLLINPHHQLKASSLHHLIVRPQHQVASSFSAKKYVSPQLPQVQQNPEPQQYTSSPKDDCVGASQIITQPTDTLPDQESKETMPKLAVKLEKTSIPSGPKIGAGRPLKVFKLSDLDPNTRQILSHHLSEPMLGIPKAIETVSKTPGISDLVAAPGYLLHTLMGKLQHLGSNLKDKSTTQNSPDFTPSALTENQDENPSVGDINPHHSVPNSACPDSPVSSPFTITLMNPMIGNPMIGNPMFGSPIMSNPMMGNPTMGNSMMDNPIIGNPMMDNPTMGNSMMDNPTMGNPMIGNPMMGNVMVGTPMSNSMMGTPVHISYIHSIPSPYSIRIHNPMSSYASHVPHYIVGSPFSMPYLSNYNPDTSAVFTSNTNGNSDTSPKSPDSIVGDINTYQLNKVAETPVVKLKKVCKKSTKEEEPSQKVSRDIKATIESISEQVNQKEQIEAEKLIITHKPITEIQTDEKVETEKQATENGKFVKKAQNFGKMKITKEIIKKSKGEKSF